VRKEGRTEEEKIIGVEGGKEGGRKRNTERQSDTHL
jgi:hypothetical protein